MERAFLKFYNIIKVVEWKTPNDIKRSFSSADILNCAQSHRVIFNVGGNKYRLICGYYFGTSYIQLSVKFIGTHKEYNSVDACKVNMFKRWKGLKYTRIKDQDQYDTYCEILEDLLNDVLKYRREITKNLGYKLSKEFSLKFSTFLKPYKLNKAS